MTKAQRHKAEASRAAREADRLRGMAYCYREQGRPIAASMVEFAAAQRAKAAASHEQAFQQEVACCR